MSDELEDLKCTIIIVVKNQYQRNMVLICIHGLLAHIERLNALLLAMSVPFFHGAHKPFYFESWAVTSSCPAIFQTSSP